MATHLRLGLAQVFRLEPVRAAGSSLAGAKRVLALAPGAASSPDALRGLLASCGVDNGTLVLLPAAQLAPLAEGLAALGTSGEAGGSGQLALGAGAPSTSTTPSPSAPAALPPPVHVPRDCLAPLHTLVPAGALAGAVACVPGVAALDPARLLVGGGRPPPPPPQQPLTVPRLPGAGMPVAELLVDAREAAAARRAGRGTTLPQPPPVEGAAPPGDAPRVSALFAAARAGDLPALRALLTEPAFAPPGAPAQALAPPLAAHHDTDNGATPLHHWVVAHPVIFADDAAGGPSDAASALAAAEGVDLLLGAGAAIDAPAANGATPLHWAAGAGAPPSLIRHLLARGASPAASTYTWRRQVFGRGSGQTPAHWAAESGHVPALAALAAAAPLVVAAAVDERGASPLEVARRAATHASQAAEDFLTALASTPYVLLQVTLESAAAGWVPGPPPSKQPRLQRAPPSPQAEPPPTTATGAERGSGAGPGGGDAANPGWLGWLPPPHAVTTTPYAVRRPIGAGPRGDELK
jgi:hypothetical protein